MGSIRRTQSIIAEQVGLLEKRTGEFRPFQKLGQSSTPFDRHTFRVKKGSTALFLAFSRDYLDDTISRELLDRLRGLDPSAMFPETGVRRLCITVKQIREFELDLPGWRNKTETCTVARGILAVPRLKLKMAL